MILFFDRSIGIRIPKALALARIPEQIHYHQEHFPMDELDDKQLPIVGQNSWTVIGQDYSYHKNASEIAAIKQYGVGTFYLWGAKAKSWEIFHCFMRAYERIVKADANTKRPFIYTVAKNGQLRSVSIP